LEFLRQVRLVELPITPNRQVIKALKEYLTANNYPLKGFMIWDSPLGCFERLPDFERFKGMNDLKKLVFYQQIL
jgi:hypothetical protein